MSNGAPWKKFVIKHGNIASSQHNYYQPDKDLPLTEVAGLIMIQEANMGGMYYRVIYWYKDSNSSYFTTADDDNHQSSLFNFSKPLLEMVAGDIVEDTKNKQQFVVADYAHSDSQFIKVLEKSEFN